MAISASFRNRLCALSYKPNVISSIFFLHTRDFRPATPNRGMSDIQIAPFNSRSNLLQFVDKIDDKKKFSTTRSEYFFKGTEDGKRERYIPLMLFNEIIWPNLFKNLKTITFTNLLIRQFIDPQFKKKQFLDEATMMVLKVSKLLAIGEIDNMRGLLTDDAIKELRPNLIKMTRQQREALAVENIILGFIYSLDVKVDKSTNPQTRQVEITCCFHSSTEPMPDGSKLPSLRKIFQSRDKHLICNYRFVRDYTKGVNGRWMINRLNHFKPEDIPRQFRNIKLTG